MKRAAKRRAPRPIKFTISVLAMNGLEVTRKCIESALDNKEALEMILTDNASDDGTAAYFDKLAVSDTRITVIHNEVNQGYSAPHNHALMLAKGKFFVALNNDVEVPKAWLSEIVRPFDSNTTCAITGPSGSCCSLQAPWPSFHGSPGRNYEYVEGSCLCIPTALASEITLFAPYLHFAYAEDVDLSLRVRARGYTIHPAAFSIKHLRRFTSKNIENIKEIQQHNHKIMVERWGSYHKFRRFDLPFIVRRRGAIGDVLLTTPLISEIKRQNPQSEIFVETAAPEVFKDNPNVKEAGGPFPQYYKWATLINLDMSYENMPETNIVDAYYKTANFIGTKRRPELFFKDSDKLPIGNDSRWIAIHPGPTSWIGKNWPWERWSQFCQTLLLRGRWPLIVGTSGPALPNFLDLRGKTNFAQLAGTLTKCKAFVGVDSFPLHVAQTVGVPVVGLFGASDPRYILTPGRAESVCGVAECAGVRHRVAGQTFVDCDGACMDSITVDQVIEALNKVLS